MVEYLSHETARAWTNEICEWCEKEAPPEGHCCPRMPLDLACRRHLDPYCGVGGFRRLISALVNRTQAATVGDITKMSKWDLLRVPSIGRKSVLSLQEWLEAGGLSLVQETLEENRIRRGL